MTNNDAIYILSGLKRSLNEYCGLNNNGQKAFDMAISALQAQEAKTQLSAEGTTSDLISRQAAIDVCNYAIDLWHGQLGEGIVIAVRKRIEELPSAQPERKKGNWTKDCACEICGFKPWYERDIHTLSFCPNCGADMRGDNHDQSK